MADPTITGRLGHRFQVVVKDASTGYEEVADRVQNVEFGATHNLEKAYELGRKGPVGSAADPAEFNATIEANLHGGMKAELVIAGKDPDSDTSYTLGDIVDNDDLEVYVVMRDDSNTVDQEIGYSDNVVGSITWTFQVGGACTARFALEGTGGSFYTQNFPHASFGALNDSDPGIIKGKDARIWFGSSGSTPDADERAYRLQRFTITARFPVETVRELGRRAIVGKLLSPPDVTVDFDVSLADEQPIDKFYAAMANGYDLGDEESQHAFVRLYDPDLAEANTVLRSWVIENVRPTSTTPVRAAVRGLGTMRYALTSEKEATADSGGVTVYKGDIP
ncbi:MAG: hypothetical protein OCU12_06025 [Methanophagales archaeon]|nr:hypothetical protein [Methanophagales archaeon]